MVTPERAPQRATCPYCDAELDQDEPWGETHLRPAEHWQCPDCGTRWFRDYSGQLNEESRQPDTRSAGQAAGRRDRYSTISSFGVRTRWTTPAMDARNSTKATMNATVAACSAFRPNSLKPYDVRSSPRSVSPRNNV